MSLNNSVEFIFFPPQCMHATALPKMYATTTPYFTIRLREDWFVWSFTSHPQTTPSQLSLGSRLPIFCIYVEIPMCVVFFESPLFVIKYSFSLEITNLHL